MFYVLRKVYMTKSPLGAPEFGCKGNENKLRFVGLWIVWWRRGIDPRHIIINVYNCLQQENNPFPKAPYTR